MSQTLGLITGANFVILLIFGFAEGLIQAFVFTMLTLTYLSMEVAPEDESEEKEKSIAQS
jgi:F0F1-type ATP synthase membrane subunit a